MRSIQKILSSVMSKLSPDVVTDLTFNAKKSLFNTLIIFVQIHTHNIFITQNMICQFENIFQNTQRKTYNFLQLPDSRGLYENDHKIMSTSSNRNAIATTLNRVYDLQVFFFRVHSFSFHISHHEK